MLGIAARALIASRLPAQLFVGGAAIDAVESVLEVPGVRLPADIGDAADLIRGRLTG
jgi:hypothetical protein